jgi:hypothetical protein
LIDDTPTTDSNNEQHYQQNTHRNELDPFNYITIKGIDNYLKEELTKKLKHLNWFAIT